MLLTVKIRRAGSMLILNDFLQTEGWGHPLGSGRFLSKTPASGRTDSMTALHMKHRDFPHDHITHMAHSGGRSFVGVCYACDSPTRLIRSAAVRSAQRPIAPPPRADTAGRRSAPAPAAEP